MTEHPPALLSVRALTVSYRVRGGPPVTAVRDASLDVAPGEVVALVGGSGSGKSTLAHALVGLLPAGGRRESGQVLFDGTDLAALPEPQLRARRGRDLALVPQDPLTSLNPVQRVGRQVAEVLLLHGLADREQAPARAVELLDLAGVPDPGRRARQYPHELSGGLCQRVLIAIAMAGGPRLIVADEPTSSLDALVQRRVLDELGELTRRSGTALLLVTHDLGSAAERAGRLVVMSGGTVVESGPTEQLLERPAHPYTRELLAAAPGLTPRRYAPPRPVPTVPLLTARGLVHAFPGAPAPAVDGVGFEIGRGETFALVGESGSGKSTTARLVARLARPTGGELHFDGREVTTLRGTPLRELRRRVQLVQQSPYASLDPRHSVARIVGEPLRAFRTGGPGAAGRRARAALVAEMLERVALPADTAHRRPAELSGGQRQRVAIARALVLRPDLVVCDEPVSALDVTVQGQILHLLAELQAELGVAYLFITHDLAVVRQIAHRVGVLRSGRLVETGDVDTVLTAPAHPYTRELLAAVPGPPKPAAAQQATT
ncbi:peptide ABC transporter ATP-binding protein [Kitasatospora phosalacinea]|uniref:Peptide ABC transporter ATP-binding protein n=1 Tax=Kitasatospora phosalacinea TaxID=2065 RepID=A0A9W6QDP3_9ACTN|nr:ABC transporter ATP-binding protein [Kitasatospora phosalacinea]GLW72642.1 peptide ABC transporter ATP-binding protein [Kitasatospora phosalacinea]